MDWLTKNLAFKIIFLFLLCCTSLAQRPSFPVKTIQIKNIKLNVEVAKGEERTSYGLMKIKSLPKSVDGMLFIFPSPRILSFWMKNTWIPLSIAFINENFKIVSIQKMRPESSMLRDESLKRYQSPVPVRYALELPLGGFEKRSLTIGDQFKKF